MNAVNNFYATYQFSASTKSEAEILAHSIAVEQSVEMPPETVPEEFKSYIAEVSELSNIGDNNWHATIQFSTGLVGSDPVQFLNVLFGNSSIKPNIKMVDVDRGFLSKICDGPSFGISGIRTLLKADNRALSCTALKPVGLTPAHLAERAYHFSRGGIDIIKDDHGLANQPSAPFKSRVQSVVRAVRKGEQISGKKTLYFPNITGSNSEVFDRFKLAADLGADGVLISPQLTGLSVMQELAAKSKLPIMAHPAFSGVFVNHPTGGITPELYYGLLWRAFGADAVIYPNAGGRFGFSEEQCMKINHQCRAKIAGLRTSLPTPGGGIDRKTIPSWLEKYGKETIFLIGGSLYQHPSGLEEAAREFQQMLHNDE